MNTYLARAALGAASLLLLPLGAQAQTIFPAAADVSHASPGLTKQLLDYFTVKSQHDVAGTMAHFSHALSTYVDTTLGWDLAGYAAVDGMFSTYMPQWPESGISYPTRILGDENSALVLFTDTPELFGGELRIMGALDFRDGKIVRWADYWDGRSIDQALYDQLRTPQALFPADFHETEVGENGSAKMRELASALQTALAEGDAAVAAALFAPDAVLEDLTLRTQIVGQGHISAYLARALAVLPYGRGARLRHVVGSDLGGGYEWWGAPHSPVATGITAAELDAQGQISRLTVLYDGRVLSDDQYRALAALALSP